MVAIDLARSGIPNRDGSVDLRIKQDFVQASKVYP